MCYPATCPSCRKTTWAGCGQHADTVMRSVAASDRCTCTEQPAPKPKSGFFRTRFGR